MRRGPYHLYKCRDWILAAHAVCVPGRCGPADPKCGSQDPRRRPDLLFSIVGPKQVLAQKLHFVLRPNLIIILKLIGG